MNQPTEEQYFAVAKMLELLDRTRALEGTMEMEDFLTLAHDMLYEDWDIEETLSEYTAEEDAELLFHTTKLNPMPFDYQFFLEQNPSMKTEFMEGIIRNTSQKEKLTTTFKGPDPQP